MAIAGGIHVAESASRCLYSAAGMLRFLARLSGRRRHVRRNCGGGIPGAGNIVVETQQDHQKEVEINNMDCKLMIDPSRINDNVRQRFSHCRQSIDNDYINTESLSSSSNLIDNNHYYYEERLNFDGVDAARISEESNERISGNTSSTTTTTTTEETRRTRRCQDDHGQSSGTSSTDNCRRHHQSPKSIEASRFRRRYRLPSYLATLLLISYTLFGIADACSSRSVPRARPPPTTTPTATPPRPNITIPTYTCAHDYAEWFCLHGGTCFTVILQGALLYNCLCAEDFMGQRCEFHNLDNSYIAAKRSVMLETASIAGGATIAVFLVVIICVAAYVHCKRKQKELRTSTGVDTVDGPGRDPELRPFCYHSRSLAGFKTKNQNCSPAMCLPIEQTRMPGWIDYSQVDMTRLASINEAKRSSH